MPNIMGVHLGLMLECETRTNISECESFEEAFALSTLTEACGLDSIWVAERHFATAQRVQQGSGGFVTSVASAPLVMASAIGSRTSRVRVGTAVSVLPLAHPVRLAEEVATLDHVLGGRLDFGCGRSGFATTYAAYAISYAESRDRFQECLDILLEAWTQDCFSYSGKYYDYEDVFLVPKPLQKPHPPVRVAATSSDTYSSVGRQGFPIFTGLRIVDVPQLTEYLAIYRQAWREAGHPGQGDVYLRIPVYVAESMEQARADPEESTLKSYRRLGERYATQAPGGGGVSAERAALGQALASADYDEILRSRVAYGTPEAVSERLSQLRDNLGLSGFVIEPNVGGAIPRDKVFQSVRLFAETVAPALRGGVA